MNFTKVHFIAAVADKMKASVKNIVGMVLYIECLCVERDD